VSEIVLGFAAQETPEVNTEAPPEGEGWLPPSTPDDAPPVAEVVVRGLLAGIGAAASTLAAPPELPEAWRFTARELDDLTPPLTRIINARPALRRAVHRGDHLSVAIQLAAYAGRNVNDLRQLRGGEEDDHGFDDQVPGRVPGGLAGVAGVARP
jgi:hypothetical protein